MDGATPVSIRVRRSIPEHDAYTVLLADRRFAVLATARAADARRWVCTTRWLHGLLIYRGRLVVGLGVQWTPTRRPLGGSTPVPATLQLCVGHRCLVFHLAQACAVPEAMRRFLADPRITFVGAGNAYDHRMLRAHYGIHVACGRELRAMAGMGNASMEEMAERLLGYPGVSKSRDVAMSAWHAPRLSTDQVLYAAVDAFLAFRLGVHLCPDGAAAHQNRPVHQAPPARVHPPRPVPVHPAPRAKRALVLDNPLPPFPRGPVLIHPAPRVQRAPAYVPLRQQASPAARPVDVTNRAAMECSPRAFCGVAIMAPAGVEAANGTGKVVNTGVGLTGSDTDGEADYDSDVDDVATHDGLPVRACASDSEDGDCSSDGFEYVGFGAFTDEEDGDCVADEDDDQEYENTICTGFLGTLTVDDEEQEEEEEYDAEIGILIADSKGDDEFTGDVDEEEGVAGGGCASEYLGDGEAVLDDGGEDDALGQDDWNHDGDDYYGSDDLDVDDDDDQELLL